MPSAAQIMDVFNRDRNYTLLRRARSERYAKLRKKFVEEVEVYQSIEIHDKTVSAAELERIKNKIRNDIRKQEHNQLVLTSLTAALIFIVIALIVHAILF